MILAMQSEGLAVRLKHIGCSTVVIGLSGGLDSTLALLVAVRAFDRLKLPYSGIKTYSMPGFGTTSRTKSNAQKSRRSWASASGRFPSRRRCASIFPISARARKPWM